MTPSKKDFFKPLANGKKALAVLIDPDQSNESVSNIVQLCNEFQVDYIFVGGSLITSGVLAETLQIIKRNYLGPVYLFPGNEFMVDEQADGILFLSLLSGRNPEYLIGKQVVSAPGLSVSNLDIVSTAYLLIDGGRETSVSYISNTKPIPSDKSDIAVATALAGKFMGMACTYLDAGSGATHHVPGKTVLAVKKSTQNTLIVGGGIRNGKTALELYQSGADILVIGNGVENNIELIESIVEVRNSIGQTVEI